MLFLDAFIRTAELIRERRDGTDRVRANVFLGMITEEIYVQLAMMIDGTTEVLELARFCDEEDLY